MQWLGARRSGSKAVDANKKLPGYAWKQGGMFRLSCEDGERTGKICFKNKTKHTHTRKMVSYKVAILPPGKEGGKCWQKGRE